MSKYEKKKVLFTLIIKIFDNAISNIVDKFFLFNEYKNIEITEQPLN